MTAEPVLALIARLKARSRRAHKLGSIDHAGDLRLSAHYLRRFASLLILEESKTTTDPMRRHVLEVEASALWCDHGGAP